LPCPAFSTSLSYTFSKDNPRFYIDVGITTLAVFSDDYLHDAGWRIERRQRPRYGVINALESRDLSLLNPWERGVRKKNPDLEVWWC